MTQAQSTLRRGARSQRVAALQTDLRELGFNFLGEADGSFGLKTELAVREFQIYAKYATVAKEGPASGPGALRYVARLSPADNTRRYQGFITGEADAATLDAIAAWKRQRLRCPVVIEAWTMRNGQRQGDRPLRENVWLHDEVRDGRARLFARDFSAYYPPLPGRAGDELIGLGDYVQSNGAHGGPQSLPPHHTWSECEVTPEAMFGQSFAEMLANPAQTSTFKVVRAISEAECRGYLDSMNCWDNVFVSFGPFHWPLGASTWREGGELGGFLAFLQATRPDAYEQALGFCGIRASGDWGSDGASLFASGSRRYNSRISLQQPDGTYRLMSLETNLLNYFRTWHWFYRYMMAVRSFGQVRQAMWDMARIRIRDVLSTEFGDGYYVSLPNGSQRPATIGDIFTSERAVAAIVRWHIRYPAHIVRGGKAGTALKNAAGQVLSQPRSKDVGAWDREDALIDALARSPDAPDTLGNVLAWPAWGRNPRGYRLDKTLLGPLSTQRGSFRLDNAGLAAPQSLAPARKRRSRARKTTIEQIAVSTPRVRKGRSARRAR